MASQVKTLRLDTSAFFTIAGLWTIKDSIKLTFIEYVTYAPKKGAAQSVVVFENGEQAPNLPPVDESNPALPKSVLCSMAVFDLEYAADKDAAVQDFIKNNPDSIVIHKEETTESLADKSTTTMQPTTTMPPPTTTMQPTTTPQPTTTSLPKRPREEECKPTRTNEEDQDPYPLDKSNTRWKAVLNNMQIVGSKECVQQTIGKLRKAANKPGNIYENYGIPPANRTAR
jgi:hypothetical protein